MCRSSLFPPKFNVNDVNVGLAYRLLPDDNLGSVDDINARPQRNSYSLSGIYTYRFDEAALDVKYVNGLVR